MPTTDPTPDQGALPDGYRLVALDGRGVWVQLHHQCGKVATFVRPTPNRVTWHVSSHRCGPIGSGWQESGAPPSADPFLWAVAGVEASRRAVETVRDSVARDLEPDYSELAAVVLGRLDSAAHHLAAAADHLAEEGGAR